MVTTDGETLVVLGLTPENIARLEDDKTIVFNMAEMDLPPMKVVIAVGASEDYFLDQLSQLCSPDTEIRDFRLPGQ